MSDPIKDIEERWKTINQSVLRITGINCTERMHQDIRNLLELVKAYENELMTCNYETDAFNEIKSKIFKGVR